MKKPRLAVGPFNCEEQIKKGVYVLLANHRHHFWVQVAEVFEKNVIGMICSRLSSISSYGFGDIIQFSHRHVFDIFTSREDQIDANTQRNHRALVDE